MKYRMLNRLPIPGTFWEMSKEEAKGYVEWFHTITPERISELSKAVGSTPGFQDWAPDGTPESLEMLGQWFAGVVETRPKTKQEVDEETNRLGARFEGAVIDSRALTDQTFSLAVDVGMYFAQVIMKNVPGTRWTYLARSRRNVDYGQPVIIGGDRVPLNPVQIVKVLARKLARGNAPGSSLRELFDIWRDALQPQSESGSNIG